MYIERLHIDRFGILNEQDVPGLSPGLSLFSGHNEAGKSTCLRFFQSMLFGYKRGNRTLDPMPERRGKSAGGGSLFLHTESFGDITLTRRPGAHGGVLTLTQPTGQPLAEADFQRLLGGLTMDVFDNIFAFSLKSLMELSALKGDSIRHALHGAAFGMGLQSPAQVIKTIDDRMSILLKRDTAAASAAINNILREIGEVQEELRARGPDMLRYKELQDTMDAVEARLTACAEARSGNEREERRVQRRLSVWQQWEDARRVQAELAEINGSYSFPDHPFAPDAVQRLETLLAQQEDRLVAVQEQEQAQAALEADMAALASPDSLADLHPAVQSLREQKERRRTEAEQLPALETECASLAAAQEEILARLGPGWTAEAIAAADTSLFTKEALLQFSQRLAAKEDAARHAQREHDRLAEERSEAAAQEEAIRNRLEQSGAVATPLPEKAAVENIAAGLARAKTALADLPRLHERQDRANAEARRSLNDIDPAWTPEILERFDTSLRARQLLAEQGTALSHAHARHEDAGRTLALADAAYAEASEKTAAAEQRSLQYRDVPDAATLESRHALLKQLERASIECAAAQKDYEAANNAVSNHVAPLQPKTANKSILTFRNPLLLAGLLLLLAGLGLAGMGLQAGTQAFLYGGGVLAAIGLLACLLHPKTAPPVVEPQQHTDESALLHARSSAKERHTARAAQVAALAGHAARWLNASDPEEPSEAEIERALRLLEIQGQKLALQERDFQELFTAQQALSAAAQRLEQTRQQVSQSESALHQCSERWQAHVRDLHLPPATAPEAAAGIFDRVETARARAAAATETAQAATAALACIRDCLRLSLQQPFFSAALPQGLADALASEFCDTQAHNGGTAGESSFTALAAQCLESLEQSLATLRAHEQARQDQRQLQAIHAERSETRARVEQRLTEAGEQAKAAHAVLLQEQEDWQNWLRQRGLAPSLSPKTASEALDGMLDFMARRKVLAARQGQYEGIIHGLRQFTQSVTDMARRAGLSLPAGAGQQASGFQESESPALPTLAGISLPAIFHLLDTLARSVDAALHARALHSEKAEQHNARNQSLIRARAALSVTRESIGALLHSVAAPDAEAFRSAFARWQHREALRSQERSLLAGMHSLAAEEGVSVEDVLASFETTTLESLREEHAHLCETLTTLEAETRTLAEERGQVRERRDALTGSEGNAPLRRREAMLREELHRLSRQWSVLALAKEFLLTAKSRFEEEGQQGVIRFAGDLFASITDGEYTGITASLEGEAFTAIHHSGDRRDPEKQLSQGAREQLYLALRLAYVKNHAANADTLPIIMDDIMVNFDPARAANTARVLAEFALENQILFFTCHPLTADLLYEAGVKAAQQKLSYQPALFDIVKGEINRVEKAG